MFAILTQSTTEYSAAVRYHKRLSFITMVFCGAPSILWVIAQHHVNPMWLAALITASALIQLAISAYGLFHAIEHSPYVDQYPSYAFIQHGVSLLAMFVAAVMTAFCPAHSLIDSLSYLYIGFFFAALANVFVAVM